MRSRNSEVTNSRTKIAIDRGSSEFAGSRVYITPLNSLGDSKSDLTHIYFIRKFS